MRFRSLIAGCLALLLAAALPAGAQEQSGTPPPTGATLTGAPSNPTGTSATAGVMAGLGVSTCKITPTKSSRLYIDLYGVGSNGTAGDGYSVDLRFGTGAAPANAAALSGTVIGTKVSRGAEATGGAGVPFHVGGVVTGLTPGTQIWIDAGEYAVTGGTASLTAITCSAFEM